MKIVEIFDSIDGEGKFTGTLATFIRLGGCNMRCSYCDTGYALKATDGVEMTVEQIIDEVKRIGNKHVTLTGGEPLQNKSTPALVDNLCKSGYFVNIETNGSFDVSAYQNENTIITMDYKTISSGENHKMSIERINTLRSCDVLKIVCADSDLHDVAKLLSEIETDAEVYISPVFGKEDPKELVTFLKMLRDTKVKSERIRVQIQLHKIIWNPEERGV